MRTGWLNSKLGSSSSRLLAGQRTVPQRTVDNAFLRRNHDAWLAGLPAHVGLGAPESIPTFIAVGGGKGGVGKSILSANIAAKLGQAGYKVLLVDLDLGSANLHTYFGLAMPARSLANLVLYHDEAFANILLDTPAPGVQLLAGGRDESWSDAADFGSGAFVNLWDALLHAKEEQGLDFVILDLGAGTHRHTIDFFTSAHMGVMTVLPEPTSIENAYSFLKATMWRLIENAGMRINACAAADEIKEALFSPLQPQRSGSHLQKLMSFQDDHPDLVTQILKSLSGRQIGFVVNQIRSQRDIDIGSSMQTISKNYFGYHTRSLGYLNYDDAAWKSLRNRRLLVLDFPHSILTKRVSEVAGQILSGLGF